MTTPDLSRFTPLEQRLLTATPLTTFEQGLDLRQVARIREQAYLYQQRQISEDVAVQEALATLSEAQRQGIVTDGRVDVLAAQRQGIPSLVLRGVGLPQEVIDQGASLVADERRYETALESVRPYMDARERVDLRAALGAGVPKENLRLLFEEADLAAATAPPVAVAEPGPPEAAAVLPAAAAEPTQLPQAPTAELTNYARRVLGAPYQELAVAAVGPMANLQQESALLNARIGQRRQELTQELGSRRRGFELAVEGAENSVRGWQRALGRSYLGRAGGDINRAAALFLEDYPYRDYLISFETAKQRVQADYQSQQAELQKAIEARSRASAELAAYNAWANTVPSRFDAEARGAVAALEGRVLGTGGTAVPLDAATAARLAEAVTPLPESEYYEVLRQGEVVARTTVPQVALREGFQVRTAEAGALARLEPYRAAEGYDLGRAITEQAVTPQEAARVFEPLEVLRAVDVGEQLAGRANILARIQDYQIPEGQYNLGAALEARAISEADAARIFSPEIVASIEVQRVKKEQYDRSLATLQSAGFATVNEQGEAQIDVVGADLAGLRPVLIGLDFAPEFVDTQTQLYLADKTEGERSVEAAARLGVQLYTRNAAGEVVETPLQEQRIQLEAARQRREAQATLLREGYLTGDGPDVVGAVLAEINPDIINTAGIDPQVTSQWVYMRDKGYLTGAGLDLSKVADDPALPNAKLAVAGVPESTIAIITELRPLFPAQREKVFDRLATEASEKVHAAVRAEAVIETRAHPVTGAPRQVYVNPASGDVMALVGAGGKPLLPEDLAPLAKAVEAGTVTAENYERVLRETQGRNPIGEFFDLLGLIGPLGFYGIQTAVGDLPGQASPYDALDKARAEGRITNQEYIDEVLAIHQERNPILQFGIELAPFAIMPLASLSRGAARGVARTGARRSPFVGSTYITTDTKEAAAVAKGLIRSTNELSDLSITGSVQQTKAVLAELTPKEIAKIRRVSLYASNTPASVESAIVKGSEIIQISPQASALVSNKGYLVINIDGAMTRQEFAQIADNIAKSGISRVDIQATTKLAPRTAGDPSLRAWADQKIAIGEGGSLDPYLKQVERTGPRLSTEEKIRAARNLQVDAYLKQNPIFSLSDEIAISDKVRIARELQNDLLFRGVSSTVYRTELVVDSSAVGVPVRAVQIEDIPARGTPVQPITGPVRPLSPYEAPSTASRLSGTATPVLRAPGEAPAQVTLQQTRAIQPGIGVPLAPLVIGIPTVGIESAPPTPIGLPYTPITPYTPQQLVTLGAPPPIETVAVAAPPPTRITPSRTVPLPERRGVPAPRREPGPRRPVPVPPRRTEPVPTTEPTRTPFAPPPEEPVPELVPAVSPRRVLPEPAPTPAPQPITVPIVEPLPAPAPSQIPITEPEVVQIQKLLEQFNTEALTATEFATISQQLQEASQRLKSAPQAFEGQQLQNQLSQALALQPLVLTQTQLAPQIRPQTLTQTELIVRVPPRLPPPRPPERPPRKPPRRPGLPGAEEPLAALAGIHPQRVAFNTGATDLEVNLPTAERTWHADLPEVPEIPAEQSFTVLETGYRRSPTRDFPMGKAHVTISGQGVRFKGRKPRKKRNVNFESPG